jgi:hypothetical protein
LAKGECAFAYIAGLTSTHSPKAPIVVFTLVPGKRIFDKKYCDKHYGGRVWIDGKDIFDPGQPFWGGTAPDVKWPE